MTNLKWLAAASLLALGMAGCGGSSAKSNEATPTPEPKPVAVATAAAVEREFTATLQATGSLAAEESSDVASEVSGQVVKTPVDVGAFVRQGQLIAQLNDRDARLRLEQALAGEREEEAALRQAEVRLGIGPGGRFDSNQVPEVRSARAQADAAEAQARLAETNARRFAGLSETGDVSRQTYDEARAQAETARAQANAARQQYETAVNAARGGSQGVATAQAKLASARAQTALARKAVNDTSIRAPFSGFVAERPVAAGEYVTPATKIATVLRVNPLKLLLQVPEFESGRVRPGQSVVARVSAFADRDFDGRVTVINPALDPASRTVTVEVRLDNSSNLLRPGMFATARIVQPSSGRGVFVPRAAVLTDQNTNASSVYVVDGDAARLRVVQTGEEQDGLVRIVSGVAADEAVVTSNHGELYDGAKVQRQ
ncbi:MAG TPA: efflux RND transporter periplasmic adaptor subunit [Blastocatellia bacterium]|nr:efflux RND transporter periplasmic adaptor subunit [Blastocatellia bacterium]